jgi:hypothetical protein
MPLVVNVFMEQRESDLSLRLDFTAFSAILDSEVIEASTQQIKKRLETLNQLGNFRSTDVVIERGREDPSEDDVKAVKGSGRLISGLLIVGLKIAEPRTDLPVEDVIHVLEAIQLILSAKTEDKEDRSGNRGIRQQGNQPKNLPDKVPFEIRLDQQDRKTRVIEVKDYDDLKVVIRELRDTEPRREEDED